MAQQIRFVLVLHNHQPVGNFDNVFEQAYQDSYLPFLDVLDDYPSLRIGLHTSGSLMEWLDANHPEYVDRLAGMVATGRIEIVGGAFYEPILTMIPPRDRIGQIRSYTNWLEDRLGAQVRGLWVPERVWEQTLASDIAGAGIAYTMLDDFHFKNAGLRPEELHGYYVTEDNGRVLAVFPGSETMRYTIPFADPHCTIDALREIANQETDPVVTFADDGEKFGSWPETHKHVYQDRWLRRFFDLLVENQDWIKVTTPAEALDAVAPLGRVYLPDASYREMTEWALPNDRLREYLQLRHEMEHDPRWPQLSQFVRGGNWRNFKRKYPETNEMYSRMMQVSGRLEDLVEAGHAGQTIDDARRELYRGQCNCPYWHGAFGGIYLPHLRNAIYNHLIAADNLLDQAIGRSGSWVEANAGDLNFDARQEIQLANDKVVALIAPAAGGVVYELDVRSICHNLLATVARRPEVYHEQVLAGEHAENNGAATVQGKVVFKQQGLEQRIGYDDGLRKSLVDHFYDEGATLEAIRSGEASDRGDFAGGVYEARIRRKPDRIQVQLARSGHVGERPVKITKGITLAAGAGTLDIAYLLEGLPEGEPIHFAPEFNLAGLPSGADDRYFLAANQQRLGQLGTELVLDGADSLALVDEWLGIHVGITLDRPAGIWAYPVETVSQSEGGFELVHQSVVVQPHWVIRADHSGAWSVTMQLAIDTQMAESRRPANAEAVVTSG